jgi:hypothetical protein
VLCCWGGTEMSVLREAEWRGIRAIRCTMQSFVVLDVSRSPGTQDDDDTWGV